jgi:hypothetical protein
MKMTFAAIVAVATIAAGSLATTPASAQRGLGAAVAGGIIGSPGSALALSGACVSKGMTSRHMVRDAREDARTSP